jgi:FKBP-type peptidyl-prolyl cis-trans isomerase
MRALALASIALLAGCGDHQEAPEAVVDDATVVAPAAEPGVPRVIEREDGSRLEILAEGQGALLQTGDEARVEYTAHVKEETQPCASTRGWTEPCRVRLGAAQKNGVIPGLERALDGLRVGTHARIEVPPALAYGKQGLPSAGIPPDATLVFDVRIVGSGR